MRVLTIEDDEQIAEHLVRALREAGHQVDHRDNGIDGHRAAAGGDYDVLIVDRLLPGLDGLSVIGRLREASRQTPVLILSALSAVDERIRGLRAGGDDYLVKPFVFEELLARLEVLMRRGQSAAAAPATRLEVADIELDLLARSARRGGVELDLKPQEFKLLEYMARNAGQVLTRSMILEAVWDYHFDPQTNVVDVHVSRLRNKIQGGPGQTPLIHTVRGSGYCLRESPAT